MMLRIERSSLLFRPGRKNMPKSSKIARKVAGVTVYFQNTSSRRLPK